MKFVEVGWNGMSFEAPEDFRLLNEKGNFKNGYMRFESENGILELKWEHISRRTKSISEVASEFIKQLGKKYKKMKISVKKTKATRVFKHHASYIGLKTNMEEPTYLWQCDESKRIILCHFAFKSMNETSREIVKRVIETFKCHGEGPNTWSILGFSFKAPPTFLLTDRKMTVGGSHLLLVERETGLYKEMRREIFFQYYSMANILFKDDYKDPVKWMENNYIKNLKKRYRKLKFQEVEPRRFRRHTAAVQKGASKSGFFWRGRSAYINLTWYCSKSNRMYSVTISSHMKKPVFSKLELDEEALENLAETVFSSIKCH